MQPRYRSGVALPVGSAATVLLEATLLDKGGKPLSLELGRISMEKRPDLPPVDYFTNADGRLRVAGVAPGRVTIELINYPEAAVTIEIPAKEAGRYDVGEVTLDIAPMVGRAGE